MFAQNERAGDVAQGEEMIAINTIYVGARPRIAVDPRHIERVHVLPRRMVGGNVQRPEIAPVILDIRPLGDRKPHRPENRRHLFNRPADRMDQPASSQQRRQRHIHPLPRQPRLQRRPLQHHPPRLDRPAQRVLQLIQRRPPRPLLLGRHLAQLLQQRGQRTIAPQHGNAHRIPGAQIPGGGQRGVGLGLQVQQVVGHLESRLQQRHAKSS